MAQISEDGLFITGTCFPDTTQTYAALISKIVSMYSALYDDGTGTDTIAPCTIIFFGASAVSVTDNFEELFALWSSALTPPSG